MRYLILALSLAVPVSALAQAPVCWKNEQGVTECGNHPPPNAQTRQVRAPQPATSGDAEVGDDLAARAMAEKRCFDARATRDQYRRADYLYEVGTDGEQRVLDAAATEAAKAEAERVAIERCAGFPEAES